MTDETPLHTRSTLTPVRKKMSLISPLVRQRTAIVDWISEMECSHAVTLNVNRSVSMDNIRKMFGQFCKRVDEYRFGRTHVPRIISIFRFTAIAFVEHPNSNIHLHVAARLDRKWLGYAFGPREERALDYAWRNIVQGSGSTCIKEMGSKGPAAGWGRYATKDYRSGAEYFHSHDFHPDRSVLKSLELQKTLTQLALSTGFR
ncbi:hypothetical protein QCD71_10585 [Sphingomonas sp. PsM26]|nr:hypothetical protein [Sphingomonas sp. PsM26]